MSDDAFGSIPIPPPADRRIRLAMRILENEQTPLVATADVAARVGLSLFYFTRLFEQQVGLSPADYGRAVLLSCAASRLRYSDDPVRVVAKDFGYAKQATFNKAFTRHHGTAPARWRRQAKVGTAPASGEGVRLEHRPAVRCLARRVFGPRTTTAAAWTDFLAKLPQPLRDNPRVGFSYDDPRVTPPERIRYDCAVEVRRGTVLPRTLGRDGLDLLRSPAGLWAMVDRPPDRIADGYRAIFDGWFRSRADHAMEGDPFLERWDTMPDGMPVVTVAVRVRPIAQASDFNMAVPGTEGGEPFAEGALAEEGARLSSPPSLA